ncbi:MAG: DNA repair and recombination protein RadB [Candidatus Aenigmarchaeota archaeon]|nr:DNA repair and recombination protein RadB [Candidatus Aenigmarchaeota archaeon]
MKFSFNEPFDELLNGGLEVGCITNFYGPPGTAKTQLALLAALAVVKENKKVIFIDTEGGFSPERLEQMYGKNIEDIVDKIIIFEPKDWIEQKETFEKIEQACKENDVGLVALDSIVALWRVTITENNAQEINRELATQLSILSKIARENKIPVLVTNQVYDDIETGETKMSCKNIVKWWSKNIIELGLGEQTGHRFATIKKARALPEDKKIEFKITESGLEKVAD